MLSFITKKFISLRESIAAFSAKEKLFILFATLCGFFICCEYSIIRPVSNSLFIHYFSADFFPYVWIAIVPFNFLIVSLYNRLIPKWGSKKLFLSLISIVISTNVGFALCVHHLPKLTFAFFIWKEIYVLLMFQLLWSVIHSNIKMNNAKFLYGIFFGIGGLGSVFGSSFPSFFAVSYGSENLIFLTLPVYLALTFCYLKMMSYSKEIILDSKKNGGFLKGIELIKSSRFLIFILLIVVLMQMTSAIVDFQFNHFLERAFSHKDLRTEYAGRIFGTIHTMTVLFQFIGTYMLVKWMGLRKAHYIVPSTVAALCALFIAIPIFPIITLCFIAVKSLDFSIFGALKEMLYVPLKSNEKFQAKAIIDVFAYRSSKALAACMILLIPKAASGMLTWVNIAIGMLWIFSISYGFKEYDKLAGKA